MFEAGFAYILSKSLMNTRTNAQSLIYEGFERFLVKKQMYNARLYT